jgi:REP element-mobilizing transposase RayT
LTLQNDKHRRRSIRLKGYDYTQPGAYFVTLCTWNRECLFGQVVDGEMRLNNYERSVREEWFRSAEIRRGIELRPNEFIVMPNHIHGIVWIVDDNRGTTPHVEAHGRAPLRRMPRSLGSFVAGFKSSVTKQINTLRQTPGTPVWQRNYYEHIIRDDRSLNRIRQYIANNPLQWELDRENPAKIALGLKPHRQKTNHSTHEVHHQRGTLKPTKRHSLNQSEHT